MPGRNGKHSVHISSLPSGTYFLHSVLLREASFHNCTTKDKLDLKFHLRLFDSSKLAIKLRNTSSSLTQLHPPRIFGTPSQPFRFEAAP